MKALEVSQPIDTVRSHWSDAEHVAKFFPAVKEIHPIGSDRWLWSADIGGITKRWMTAVERRQDRVEWRPTDGTDNRGRVLFEETDKGTRVKLDLAFDDSVWSSKVHRTKAKRGWRVRQSLESYRSFVREGEGFAGGFRHEPQRIELQQMTRPELYELATEHGIRGRSKMRKADLVEALLAETG